MVLAILKLYMIGTALSVLAVFYGLADSFGGLMYAREACHYTLDVDQPAERQLCSSSRRRGLPVTRNNGS